MSAEIYAHFTKINTDPLNMDAMGFDGHITPVCGIRNIVIRNSEQSL